MVGRTIVEPEVLQALECIQNGDSFILTGGAGSGKTYSLVSLISQISQVNSNMPIACITYTNNAVSEIKERINIDKLYVSTIHDFLWNMIEKFQVEIKDTLVELINSKENKLFKLPEGVNEITYSFFDNYKVSYGEYYSIVANCDSTISHDHVLILAEKMFKKYKKLCDILKDAAQVILIDEYQDTAPEVVRILLEHIKKSKKKCVIGFFGDSMQAIYDDGVGSIEDRDLKRISKKQNRRNPSTVIDLGNKLRNDGLMQEPSNDLSAPNMNNGKIEKGKATFLYTNSSIDNNKTFQDLDKAKEKADLFSNWDFDDKGTKELWLTHSINAEKSGFNSLYKLYYKDSIKELIDKVKGLDESFLDDRKTFKELAEANKDEFNNRNRGNLYELAGSKYTDDLNVIINLSWSTVRSQIINKDSLLSYKYDGLSNTYKATTSRDQILRQLDDLYEVLELYKNNDINRFLKQCTYQIKSIRDKRQLTDAMTFIINSISENSSIEEVLDYAFENNLVHKTDGFEDFIGGRGYYLWERMKSICFHEYSKSIEYQKEYLPFATQHSIKGSEYDNVLVTLDNGGWSKYNFHKFFLGDAKETVKERTEKLLYVCVTRAKKELVVFMELDNDTSSEEIILKKAIELFGRDNVISIEELDKKN